MGGERGGRLLYTEAELIEEIAHLMQDNHGGRAAMVAREYALLFPSDHVGRSRYLAVAALIEKGLTWQPPWQR